MSGPPPKKQRRRRNVPVRGEWQAAPGVGWQHGEIPAAPDGLMPASLEAWNVWLRAWWAANWSPDDLPALRQLIRLYDQVERGEFVRMAELRLGMDNYGITPKGKQDRHWLRPKEAEDIPSPQPRAVQAKPAADLYAHLRVVND